MICGALALIIARAGLPDRVTVWGVVLVLALALAGYALAGGALLGARRRGMGAWLGALAGVGLGALWGVALALGLGVVYAVSYRFVCPPLHYGCIDFGRWWGFQGMLQVAPAFGVAAGIVLAIAVGLARLILPTGSNEAGT